MKVMTAVVIVALVCGCGSASRAVTIDWTTIGNPGNAHDAGRGLGGVNYSYDIGKFEVTYAQYAEFLNAVAASDTHNIFQPTVADSREEVLGITRSGTPGSYVYSVKADAVGKGPGGTDYTYANKPVQWVSMFDAMRFCNWLQNGQPVGPQGPGTTEDGAYTMVDGAGRNTIFRNSNARFVVPNVNEWYKAAFYDPSGVYYAYPTATNDEPNNNLPSADTGNSENYFGYSRPNFDADYGATDVGAYTLSSSPFGTFDQGGNAMEWTESAIGAFGERQTRGGSWGFEVRYTGRGTYISVGQGGEYAGLGFRVAMIGVPEPTTMCLGAFAMAALAVFSARRR